MRYTLEEATRTARRMSMLLHNQWFVVELPTGEDNYDAIESEDFPSGMIARYRDGKEV